MITLEHHIEELRAEYRGSLDPTERNEIAAELEDAIAALDEQNRASEVERPPG